MDSGPIPSCRFRLRSGLFSSALASMLQGCICERMMVLCISSREKKWLSRPGMCFDQLI